MFETYHIKLPSRLDKRRRLTNKDKENIKTLYSQSCPIRQIARVYENVCSRRLIQFVLFPDRHERAKETFKGNRKDGKYYHKEKHTAAMRKHRRYKKKALDK